MYISYSMHTSLTPLTRAFRDLQIGLRLWLGLVTSMSSVFVCLCLCLELRLGWPRCGLFAYSKTSHLRDASCLRPLICRDAVGVSGFVWWTADCLSAQMSTSEFQDRRQHCRW